VVSLVERNADEIKMADVMGVWRSLRFAGAWSQTVCSLLVRLAGIQLQSPWRCFYAS